MQKILTSVLLVMLPWAAQSQSLESWNLPDPAEMIRASNALCVDQAKSVLVVASHKRAGHKVEDVLALVPAAPKSLSLRVVSAMRENIEDLYAYPEISQYAYYSFRSEVCMRETLGAVRMPRFVTMQPKISDCQKQHGSEKSNDLFKCIQAVVREASPL